MNKTTCLLCGRRRGTRMELTIIMTKTKSASRNAMLFLLLSAHFGERHKQWSGRTGRRLAQDRI